MRAFMGILPLISVNLHILWRGKPDRVNLKSLFYKMQPLSERLKGCIVDKGVDDLATECNR